MLCLSKIEDIDEEQQAYPFSAWKIAAEILACARKNDEKSSATVAAREVEMLFVVPCIIYQKRGKLCKYFQCVFK